MNYAAMRHVAEHCARQGAARALLWAIAYRADRHTGECWTALRRLAGEAGISYSAAKTAKDDLLDAGLLELVLVGQGRRPSCLRIITDACCGPLATPQAEAVVGQIERRSGPLGHAVVGQIPAPSIRQEGKSLEGVEGRAGVAAPDGAAPRLEEPPAAFGRDWRAALNGSRPPPTSTTHPPSEPATAARDPADVPDPAPTLAEPPLREVAVSPASATGCCPPRPAVQADTAHAPDTARPHRRRGDQRGRRGRGRSPPVRSTSSPASLRSLRIGSTRSATASPSPNLTRVIRPSLRHHW